MCNVEFFNKYAEIFQDTMRVTDKSLPFIKKSTQIIDEDGKMLYPDDYVDKIAVRAFDPDELQAMMEACEIDHTPPDYDELAQIDVETIDNAQLGGRLSSDVLRPDKYNPIVTFYDDYAWYHPIDLGACIFEYLRQPVEVVWGYTIDPVTLLEVYDPATSVNFEWRWQMRNELIIKVCSYFGVSVRESDIFQYTQEMEKQQA